MSYETDQYDSQGDKNIQPIEYSTEEARLIFTKKQWLNKISDDLNLDVQKLILESTKPIVTREDLDNRIRALAIHILRFMDDSHSTRKIVARYFDEIKVAARAQGYTKEEIRSIVEGIFKEYGVSDSYIRKVIPHEIKDESKTNVRYRKEKGIDGNMPSQTTAATTVNKIREYSTNNVAIDTYETDVSTGSGTELGTDTEIELRNARATIQRQAQEIRNLKEKLANSIVVGQEMRIYKGIAELEGDQLPMTVAVNLKEDRLEYIEIDTDAIRSLAEKNIKIENKNT